MAESHSWQDKCKGNQTSIDQETSLKSGKKKNDIQDTGQHRTTSNFPGEAMEDGGWAVVQDLLSAGKEKLIFWNPTPSEYILKQKKN